MKNLYLVLAVLGAVIPIVFFSQFFGDPDQPGFVTAVFINGAAGGFTADLLISSFVFWVFMWQRRQVGPRPWAFIILNLLIGLSCALPAYLYFNSRQDAAASS